MKMITDLTKIYVLLSKTITKKPKLLLNYKIYKIIHFIQENFSQCMLLAFCCSSSKTSQSSSCYCAVTGSIGLCNNCSNISHHCNNSFRVQISSSLGFHVCYSYNSKNFISTFSFTQKFYTCNRNKNNKTEYLLCL